MRERYFGVRRDLAICALVAISGDSLLLLLLVLRERHPELCQHEVAELLVGVAEGEVDVHPVGEPDIRHIDLGEHTLLGEPHGVVALAIEGLVVEASEVLDARRGQVDESVEEVPHAVATDRDLRGGLVAGTHLEVGHTLASLDHDRLLAADLRERVEYGRPDLGGDFGPVDVASDVDVDHDALEARVLVRVLETELLGELCADLIVVLGLEARRGRGGCVGAVGLGAVVVCHSGALLLLRLGAADGPELLAVANRDGDLRSVRFALEADAGRLPVHDGADVGDVDGGLPGDDPALGVDPGVRLHVLGAERDPLDDHAVFLRDDAEHLADLALVGPGGDDHHFIFADVAGHQTTSGASDTIFM